MPSTVRPEKYPAFDPAILQRFVNFMSNPDEKPAIEQFGDGDKYFCVATMLQLCQDCQ